jgi:protein-tyrosine phosphatase
MGAADILSESSDVVDVLFDFIEDAMAKGEAVLVHSVDG